MKQTKSKTATRNNNRLAPINRYLTYPSRYDEADVLDTDEDRVMNYYQALEPVDVLDTDEDVIMQYYKHFLQRKSSRIKV